MTNAFSNPQVISTCADQRLLENLRECNKLLEQVIQISVIMCGLKIR